MPVIALLSDIHANAHALRAVLDDVRSLGIEHMVCCGDIVGYGPHPAECVRLVRESGAVAILGNHDAYTVRSFHRPDFMPTGPDVLANPVWAGIRHALKQLDAEAIAWLESLPMTVSIPQAVVAHASLHQMEQWPYLLDEREAGYTLEIIEDSEVNVGFFGHTHRQEWFSINGRPEEEPEDVYQLDAETMCAVVVGSVGQPRTGDPRAGWTIWDSDRRRFEFRHTPYPHDETADDIHAAGLPASSARRLSGMR